MHLISLGEFMRALGPTPKRDRFVKRTGTSLQYLRHVSVGRKSPSVELCVSIEIASDGAVRCELLRPSVDWAYLSSRTIADRKPSQSLLAAGGVRRGTTRRPAANPRRSRG